MYQHEGFAAATPQVVNCSFVMFKKSHFVVRPEPSSPTDICNVSAGKRLIGPGSNGLSDCSDSTVGEKRIVAVVAPHLCYRYVNAPAAWDVTSKRENGW